MATSIGAVAVDILRGLPKEPRLRVDTWQVPGLSGYGAQLSGLGESEFELDTVTHLADDAAAETHIQAVANVVGTVLDVEDNFGTVFPKILIISADQPRKIACNGISGAGTAYTRIVQQHWRCLKNV